MTNSFNQDYQYNNCISRGICSINPRTSSLQEIIILYLKLSGYYALKLENEGITLPRIKEIILDTISILVTNTDFTETDFYNIIKNFNAEIPQIINLYKEMCEKKNETPVYMKTDIKFNKKTDIIKFIRLGEKELRKKSEQVPMQTRNLYKILFLLAKSLCVNIQDLESFGIDASIGYISILKILNHINYTEINLEEIKKFINEIIVCNNKLVNYLRSAQVERYGIQQETDVSYSTTPGKAILVVGSNIRELEKILYATSKSEIDIYTHDEMMLAHTFPKFKEFKHLKGQYGQGVENCHLDFATFPGPIIITRHSLFNIENLYRGLLFTTDIAYSKGVIKIQDDDYSAVIESAIKARGFKTGKSCDSEKIGFVYEKELNYLEKYLSNNNYERIIIFGLYGYSPEDKSYFEKLLKEVDDKTLIISLSFYSKNKNVVCINACFDNYAIIKIAEKINLISKLPLNIFVPQCGRNAIAKIIYFSSVLNANTFIAKCSPTILNPNIIKTLKESFNIREITTPQKDFNIIKNI